MKTKLVNKIIALTLAITAMVSIFTISAASSSAAVISPSFTLTGAKDSLAVSSEIEILYQEYIQERRDEKNQLNELAQNIRDLINSTSYTENPVLS